MNKPLIAVTTGEPAGIGPEISAVVAAADSTRDLVLLGDLDLLRERGALAGVKRKFAAWTSDSRAAPEVIPVLHIPLAVPARAGELDSANARYVLALLDRALAGTQSGEFAAIVTAPVQKGVINGAGVAFSGHTEYLAERLGAKRPVMLLVAGTLRVALATTHLPLSRVPQAIQATMLDDTLRVLEHDLRRLFGIERPRIGVCGLNPHAGESGHLGTEEQLVIAPAIERARARGCDVRGPLPADTVFVPRSLDKLDVVLAMYHDQGLPVLKHAGFGHAVNVTLGLPIVRTSVDHGTACDLAGTGRADAGSLAAAVTLARKLVARVRPNSAS